VALDEQQNFAGRTELPAEVQQNGIRGRRRSRRCDTSMNKRSGKEASQ
jgi:hypothetical protein